MILNEVEDGQVCAGHEVRRVAGRGITPISDTETTGEPMDGAGHYRAAEKLLEEAESSQERDPRAKWRLELAKVHIALAALDPGNSSQAAVRPQAD